MKPKLLQQKILILYICFTSTIMMILIKNTNIPQLLLFLLLFTSCKGKNDADIGLTDTISKKEFALKQGTKLTDEFINSKKASIAHFYNKNWPNNSMNGGFLVAKNGQIIYEKYEGLANKKNNTAMSSTTALHVASVSKVMTATAILKLIDQKNFTLNQKVATLIKGFPYPDVTVQTLLNHRSGIRNYSYFTDKKIIWDRHKILTNQDIVDLLISKKITLEFKTDTRFSYCNTNFAILALIIEKATGQNYREAMKSIIFKPLGMNDTYVFDYEKDRQTANPSYRGDWSLYYWDYLDAIYGDKNIYSTPRDLLKFDMGRNDPEFFKPELLKKAFVGYSNEHIGQRNYGLGMRMINWPTGQNFYFHTGWWHGNTSMYITLPIEKVTIIALSNKFTKTTYRIKNLAPLFGDYPFEVDKTLVEE
ncbi:serine hydrolase domain-containing protein [Flavobacterium sp. 7A]|uniref:serine hydrolase domain-containing protein n=1 Tax=Flavobacterium sp. 7A TaxID=2940571 RepID=UPI0029CAC130|nr:serine hydrolase domain-containing protein [Flavobacterium sp. 7A]MCW2119582.1 CubicO group peptidase (beta-lactamase class C family) [Flavobacterium sp. 7A]